MAWATSRRVKLFIIMIYLYTLCKTTPRIAQFLPKYYRKSSTSLNTAALGFCEEWVYFIHSTVAMRKITSTHIVGINAGPTTGLGSLIAS